MDKKAVIEALQFLERCLRDNGLSVSKIVLFGSWALGKGTEESDIDVAIVSEDFRQRTIFERAALTKDAEVMTIKRFMIPMDILTLTPEELETEAPVVGEYVREAGAIYIAR
jgi:predicted nucleotidyltransferase